jgi:hypothetical protein
VFIHNQSHIPGLPQNNLHLYMGGGGGGFELPIVKTERFKNTSINRCLFNFI